MGDLYHQKCLWKFSNRNFPPQKKNMIFSHFWWWNGCSALRSALMFQNVPDKQRWRIHVMSKQQYRSEMGIMGDILDVTMDGGREGVIVSAISRRANLSHYAVLDKCEKLVTAGLVDSVKNERNRLFMITEKGLEFFQEFRRFQDLVESMNLRY